MAKENWRRDPCPNTTRTIRYTRLTGQKSHNHLGTLNFLENGSIHSNSLSNTSPKHHREPGFFSFFSLGCFSSFSLMMSSVISEMRCLTASRSDPKILVSNVSHLSGCHLWSAENKRFFSSFPFIPPVVPATDPPGRFGHGIAL